MTKNLSHLFLLSVHGKLERPTIPSPFVLALRGFGTRAEISSPVERGAGEIDEARQERRGEFNFTEK